MDLRGERILPVESFASFGFPFLVRKSDPFAFSLLLESHLVTQNLGFETVFDHQRILGRFEWGWEQIVVQFQRAKCFPLARLASLLDEPPMHWWAVAVQSDSFVPRSTMKKKQESRRLENEGRRFHKFENTSSVQDSCLVSFHRSLSNGC